MLATDHAPHAVEEKEVEYDLAERPFTVDLKKKTVTTSEALTTEQAKAAIFILAVKNDQLQYDLDSVRELVTGGVYEDDRKSNG